MQYARFQVPPNELEAVLERMRALEFVGCNLTVPHKATAIRLVDEVQERAEEIGAINTIAFREKRSLGWNTDCLGFSRGLHEAFDILPRYWRILLLGAGGGAGRAIAWQCALEGCSRLVLVNRDFQKAQEYARQLGGYFAGKRGPNEWLRVVPWDERAFRSELSEVDLVVNATPLGLRRTDPLPWPADLLSRSMLVCDLNYQVEPSPLLRAAKKAGAQATNGLTMLLHQGGLAFEHWFNRAAPLESMRAALGMRPVRQ